MYYLKDRPATHPKLAPIFYLKSLQPHAVFRDILGTLRSNDPDNDENVKKPNRFYKQNNSFARASHFFVHFFPVFARLRRENA